MTTAEAMAIAVLKGEMTAAYALADRLIEERDDGPEAMRQAAQALAEQPAALSIDVWRWPEFQAFCGRADILTSLRTTGLTIDLSMGQPMRVTHQHIASDTNEGDA